MSDLTRRCMLGTAVGLMGVGSASAQTKPPAGNRSIRLWHVGLATFELGYTNFPCAEDALLGIGFGEKAVKLPPEERRGITSVHHSSSSFNGQ